MHDFKQFLASSTIHGLQYIEHSRNFVRVFWILVVFAGFFGAGMLIRESFINWDQRPMTTLTETLSINDVTLPNVTVCPPKDDYLNLNFDIIQLQKKGITEAIRKELFEYSITEIQNYFYEKIIKSLENIQDPDMYYNWYHGYTSISYPYEYVDSDYRFHPFQFYHIIKTRAPYGNISTQYFGDSFDVNKLENDFYIRITLEVPERIRGVSKRRIYKAKSSHSRDLFKIA